MTKNTFAQVAVSLALGSMILSAALPAFAATTTASTTKKQKAQSAQLAKIITRGDKAIDARVADLATLASRIGEMKNLSDAEKSSLTTAVQAQSVALTALKAKLDADTDSATALADEKTITVDYRIYALIVPQGHIAAASDRALTIAGLLDSVSAKLQIRIAAAQAAGKDVTAVSVVLADMNAKIADLKTQAATAGNSVLSLVPDKGDATVAASNKAALVAAHGDIKSATADIQAARKDAKTILADIKAFHLPAAVAATSTATTTTAQ